MNKVILLLVLCCCFFTCENTNSGQVEFELSPQETLAVVLDGNHLIHPEEAMERTKSSPEKYQLVDLRSQAAFTVGHLGDAINIPTQYLLDDAYLSQYTNQETNYIFYGNNESQANGPWLLLRQMGMKNIKVMQGGYEYFTALADSTSETIAYLSEQAKYDYPAIFQQAVDASEAALKVEMPKPRLKITKPKPAPPKKKVVQDEEGGC